MHASPECGAGHCDVASYFALAESGVLQEDERTELLDGLIVAMAPQSPLHAAAVYRAHQALRAALGDAAVIRVQMPLVAGPRSVPEPDLAVLAGNERDYVHRHPGTALLVVEVAVHTVAQDRLTKRAIYAGAAVANYWIVHPGEEWIEACSGVDPDGRDYASVRVLGPGDDLEIEGLPDVRLRCVDLLPARIS